MTGRGGVTTGPLPIGQFVQLVKQTVVRDPLFKHQALKGEVTQWKQYPSGHTYFSPVSYTHLTLPTILRV